jgi:L-iditol 2-dehydrogenase
MGAADGVVDIELELDAGERQRRVKSLLGDEDADVVVEATGVPVAVAEGIDLCRPGGRYLVLGQYTDHGPLPEEARFNPHLDLNKKHLDVRGCWGSEFSHFYRGAQIISNAERSTPWKKMKHNRYGLSEANEALADVASGRVLKALIQPST